MFLPKPLRKFVGILRGDVSAFFIFLSVALGFWFGLTPGWYGLHVALLIVVLILNVHLGLFLLSAAVGKALCYAAPPLLFHVGRWAQGSLGVVIDGLASLPIVGITDFSRYSVSGALVVGPVIGLVGGLLLALSVTRFRRAWLTLEENSEAFRKWQSRGWVRWLDWLLIGKRVKNVREVLKRRPRVIRLAGVILALVVLGASAVGLHYLPGERLTEYVSASLSTANGADVTIASLNLAVLSGRVSATDVQAVDPRNPSHNRVAIGELVADASVWDIARGKLVMEDVSLKGVAFDQPRTAEARRAPAPAAERESRFAFDPSRYDLSDVDVAKVQTYFKNAREVDGWLKRIREWLPEPEARPPAPAVPQRYLEYLTARAPTRPTPRIMVKRAMLEDMVIPVDRLGRSTVSCTNLSDAPVAARLPVTVTVKSNEFPTELRIVGHYDKTGGGAEVSGRVDDVDLAELQKALSPANPVVFESGTASTEISGFASRETMDVSLRVATKGLRARSTGSALFDLDPRITDEVVKALENVKTTLRLVGPITEPRLVFDSSALKSEFKDALVAAGKAELASRLDQLVGDKLPGDLPDAKEVLEDPLGKATGALDGLIKGRKSKEDEKKDD